MNYLCSLFLSVSNVTLAGDWTRLTLDSCELYDLRNDTGFDFDYLPYASNLVSSSLPQVRSSDLSSLLVGWFFTEN